MKKSILFIFTLILAIFFVACNDTTTTDTKMTAADSTAKDSKSVEDYIRKEALNFGEEIKRGDSVALASHYASDAVVMPPNSDAVTGKNIVGLWGGALRMGVKDFKLNITDITGGGDVYAETGTYEMFGADNKSMEKGKYVAVWKKYNGNWKMYRDIWNSNSAAPTK
jgi:ketosteroid isomerase-like protein